MKFHLSGIKQKEEMQCAGDGECLEQKFAVVDKDGKVHEACEDPACFMCTGEHDMEEVVYYTCKNTPQCCFPVKCPDCPEMLPQVILDCHEGRCMNCAVQEFSR